MLYYTTLGYPILYHTIPMPAPAAARPGRGFRGREPPKLRVGLSGGRAPQRSVRGAARPGSVKKRSPQKLNPLYEKRS